MYILFTLLSYRGRINRRTFWLGGMVPVLLIFIAFLALAINLRPPAINEASGLVIRTLILAPLALIYYIWFAVTVKRCHDLGKSGWLSLLTLIPLIGLAFLLWMGLSPGDPEANRHGPPLGPETAS